MSYDENLKSLSFDADATVGIYTGISGLPGSAVPNGGQQYKALALTGKNQVGLGAVGGTNFIGVLQNKPQRPGQACTVGVQGISLVLAGGVIAAGDLLTTNAAGQFITNAVPGPASVSVARAVAPAAGAGELISALLLVA